MLNELIKKNNDIINSTNDENVKNKHLLIKKILEDKECFLKMDIETSYALLRELNIKEEDLKSIFSSLIDPIKDSNN